MLSVLIWKGVSSFDTCQKNSNETHIPVRRTTKLPSPCNISAYIYIYFDVRLISPVISLKTASLGLLRNTEQLVHCEEGSDFLSGVRRTGISFFRNAPTLNDNASAHSTSGRQRGEEKTTPGSKDGALSIWKRRHRHTILWKWDLYIMAGGWEISAWSDQENLRCEILDMGRGRWASSRLRGKGLWTCGSHRVWMYWENDLPALFF